MSHSRAILSLCQRRDFSARSEICRDAMLFGMEHESDKLAPRDYVVESIKAEIELSTPSRRQRIFEAIALAALGSIPWVGGVIAAASSAIGKYKDGESQSQRDDLLTDWLQEHQEKLQNLRATLEQMVLRLEGFGEEVEERIQSKQYLTLDEAASAGH